MPCAATCRETKNFISRSISAALKPGVTYYKEALPRPFLIVDMLLECFINRAGPPGRPGTSATSITQRSLITGTTVFFRQRTLALGCDSFTFLRCSHPGIGTTVITLRSLAIDYLLCNTFRSVLKPGSEICEEPDDLQSDCGDNGVPGGRRAPRGAGCALLATSHVLALSSR